MTCIVSRLRSVENEFRGCAIVWNDPMVVESRLPREGSPVHSSTSEPCRCTWQNMKFRLFLMEG